MSDAVVEPVSAPVVETPTAAATTTETTTTAAPVTETAATGSASTESTAEVVAEPDTTPAGMYEQVRNKYGEKVFGDLTKKEAQAALKELGRYATLDDALTGLLEAKKALRSTKIEKGLGKDATPEQVAEWREANGIPKEAKQYFDKLPDGLVIGDDDLPVFVDFAESLHKANAKPEHIHAAVEWYNGHLQKLAEHRAVQDVNFQDEAKAALKAQYGGSYEKNLNIANNHIAQMFGEDQIALMSQARAPDGRKLFDIPEVVHGFLKAGLEINPAATLMPSGGGSAGAIDSELDTLRKEFSTNRAKFMEEGKHKRMDELLTIQEKVRTR